MSKSDEQIQKESDKRLRAANKEALPPTAKRGGEVADWRNADPEMVLQLVCVVGVTGGAVRFGYTRDGGAYSIGIYAGSDSKTYYCNEADGINDQLRELANWFEK